MYGGVYVCALLSACVCVWVCIRVCAHVRLCVAVRFVRVRLRISVDYEVEVDTGPHCGTNCIERGAMVDRQNGHHPRVVVDTGYTRTYFLSFEEMVWYEVQYSVFMAAVRRSDQVMPGKEICRDEDVCMPRYGHESVRPGEAFNRSIALESCWFVLCTSADR